METTTKQEGHPIDPFMLPSACPFLAKPKQKTMGGCPLQIGQKMRSPGLDVQIKSGYDECYQSSMHYVLRSPPEQPRTKFQQYPIYLKHTLFHQKDKHFTEIRKQSIEQRFIVFEQLREQGNKYFHKGKLEQAISLYEQANSLVIWLECDEPMAMNYHDNNTRMVVSHKEQDGPYSRMGTSMLFQVFLSMAVTYMKMNHYRLAGRAAREALSLDQEVSMACYRLSQSISKDMTSTKAELEEAEQMARRALVLRENETLFQQSNTMLVMLGLGDAKGCYEKQLEYTLKRIQAKEQEDQQILESILDQVVIIERVEESRVEQGIMTAHKLKQIRQEQNEQEYREQKDSIQNMEIVKRLEQKYYSLIDYLQQGQKHSQLQEPKAHLQNIKRVLSQMNKYNEVNIFQGQSNKMIVLAKEKGVAVHELRIQKRMRRICIQRMEEIFDRASFNYEMYVLCLREHIQYNNKNKRDTPKEEPQQKQQIFNELNSMTVMPPLVLAILVVLAVWWVLPGDAFRP